jgi:hypothetical protein
VALSVAVLELGLAQMQLDPPATPIQVAERLTSVYARYARTAQAAGIPPLLTGVENSRMILALVPVLSPAGGSAPRLARGLGTALLAFWTGVVFGPGVFTTFPSALCLGCVQTAFQGYNPTAVAARKLASCLHQATLASVVTFPLPVGPVPLI